MESRTPRRKLALIALVGQLLFTIHILPSQAEEIARESAAKTAVAWDAQATEGAKGLATYYAKRYNGRRTTSGSRYNPEKLTAAHHDLPLGARVRVINLANGREVVVTINDRCRKRKQPIIDLSGEAARRLGFLGKGTARVKIIPLDAESS